MAKLKWLESLKGAVAGPDRPQSGGAEIGTDAPQSRSAPSLQQGAARGKPQLLIHAGVHRTGTTALQLAFSRSRPLLASYGIVYPTDVATPPPGAADRRALYHHNLVWALNEKNISVDAVVDWLKRAAAETDGVVLLSSEEFARVQDLYFLNKLEKEFDVQAIFYLRRQDEWINSWYSQLVKDSAERKINEASPTQFLEFIPRFHWIRYYDLLERWADRLGRDNINVRVYEAGQVLNPTADLFYYCCGRELPPEIKTERSNDSLNAIQIELLRKLRVNRYPDRLKNQIVKAVSETARFETGNHFPRSVRQLVYDKFKIQNEQVAIDYLHRPDKVLFYDDTFPDRPDSLPRLSEGVILDFMRRFIENNRLGGGE